MKISFRDEDGYKVKLTGEQVAEILRAMGNPPGTYTLLPAELRDAPEVFNYENPCTQILFRPNYPWWEMLRKRIIKSRLITRKVPADFRGKRVMVEQEARPVWLCLTQHKMYTIYVS